MSVVPRRSIVFLTLTAALLGAPCAAAPEATPAADPVLVLLIEEALARNPDLLAARAAAAAARARPAQARSLTDPTLSVAYTNDGWSPTLGERDMTTLAIMASQDLPFPGKRRLRGEMASLAADVVDKQVERVRLGVAAAVTRAYYGLIQARELLDLSKEQAEVWREIEGVARARYAVGQGGQQDVLRVQVEVTRIGQLEGQQAAEAVVRLAELNRLLDRPRDAALETPGRLNLGTVGPALPEALEHARGVSPELGGTRVAVEGARRAVALARKDFRPDFVVQGAYMNRGGLDPMWQAGVGVRLPLYRKRLTSALAEAEALLREAEHRLASIELQLGYRTQERLARMQATEKIAALYENGIVPQDRMSVEAAVASYQVGKLPFVAVLEALMTLYGDRSTHLKLLADHARLLASLEEASLDGVSEAASMGGMAGFEPAPPMTGATGGMGAGNR